MCVSENDTTPSNFPQKSSRKTSEFSSSETFPGGSIDKRDVGTTLNFVVQQKQINTTRT